MIGPGIPVDVDDPDAAYRSPARYALVALTCAMSTLALAVVATSLWHPEGPPTGSRGLGVVKGVLATVGAGGLATTWLRPWSHRRRPALVRSGAGVAIPPRAFVRTYRIVGWGAMAVLLALFLVLDGPDLRAVVATVGAVGLWIGIWVLALSTDYSLRMDPEGIVLPRVWIHAPTRIAWDDLHSLRARRGARPTLQFEADGPEWVPADRRRVPLVDIAWTASTVVDLLTFYAQNPHHRPELADLASAETRLRILTGQAPAGAAGPGRWG